MWMIVVLAAVAPACLVLVDGDSDVLSAQAFETLPDRAHSPAGDGALRVGFLVVDGVYNTELTAPYDIFHHVPFHALPGLEVFTVGPSRRPIETFEGLHLIPDYSYGSAPRIDILVVPSAEHSMDRDRQDAELMAFVRRAGEQADVVLSLCDGAFILAQAGLLDGLTSTTFPADVARYRETYTHLDVVEGVSFVHDGKVVTSVGGAPSLEAALYLVERLYGRAVARGVARGLVIDWDLTAIDHLVTADATAPQVSFRPVPRP